MENAIVRVPSLEEAEVVKLINGPEAFTPDGEFILGPTDVRGLWTAAGFCAHGLAGAGGLGQLVAEWIVEGTPSLDAWHMDSRRFGRAYRSPALHARPNARGLRDLLRREVPRPRAAGRTAAAALADLSAPRPSSARPSARSRAGSGRTGSSRTPPGATSRCGRAAGPAGSGRPAIGAEHLACRETAALFDETSFAKIEISGEGAAGFLETLCANHVARDVGAITYTSMLNSRGGIECDFTVTRLDTERFRIVTGTAFGQHDLAWIRQHAPGARHRRGRHLGLCLPRALGPEGARDPPAAHDHAARLRLHALARARGRERPVPRSPGHLRRRARLGALLPDGVRARAVGRDLGAGPRARPRRGRVQGDRLAPAREGLPRLELRHHARRHAVRGRPRVRGQARQGRLQRPRGAARGAGARAAAPVPRARRPARRRARLRAGAGGRRSRGARHERRLRLLGRALDRLRLPAGGERASRGSRSRSRSSASGSQARSRRSRSSTRRASASAA